MSSNLKVNTILPSAGSNIGLGTNGGNLNVDGGCKVQVGTALTLGHSVGVQFATQNLHSTGFEVNNVNASGIITATSFKGNGSQLTGISGVSVTNQADNRLITATGTVDTLYGEANLTFASNVLTLTGDINVSGEVQIAENIVHSGDGNTAIGFPANDTIRCLTAGTERLRIADDGRIGINDSSPNDYELDIKKRSTATDAVIRLYNNATGSSNDTIMRYAIGGTSASNYIYFGDGDDSNSGQIRYQHSNDSMQFTAAASERLRILSNGHVAIGDDISNDTGMFKVIAADGQSDDQYVGQFKNLEATANRNWGLLIQAGSSSTDESLRVRNGANNADHLTIRGDGTISMPKQPMFGGYGFVSGGTALQSQIPAFRFSTVTVNARNDFDNTTGIFTCPVAGKYLVLASFAARADAFAWSGLYILKNGSTKSDNWFPPAINTTAAFAGSHFTYAPLYSGTVYDCAANDTLVMGYHSGYSTPANASRNSLFIMLVG